DHAAHCTRQPRPKKGQLTASLSLRRPPLFGGLAAGKLAPVGHQRPSLFERRRASVSRVGVTADQMCQGSLGNLTVVVGLIARPVPENSTGSRAASSQSYRQRRPRSAARQVASDLASVGPWPGHWLPGGNGPSILGLMRRTLGFPLSSQVDWGGKML